MGVPLGVGRDSGLAFSPFRGGEGVLQLSGGLEMGAGLVPYPEGLVRPG